MKILVVGANGFVAKNFIASLENIIDGKDKSYHVPEKLYLYKYSRYMGVEKLLQFCKDCDFVFYLAGVNRPEKTEEFIEGNVKFLEYILRGLTKQQNICPVMYLSSTQAAQNNAYGESKRAGEKLLIQYGQEMDVPVYIYRLTNIFGKWSKPNYNSVVATFCHNIARGIPIRIDDPEKKIRLLYIDDVIDEFIKLLNMKKQKKIENPMDIKNIYEVTLKELADMIYEFKACRENRKIPDIRKKSFAQRLYSTYLTYVPTQQLIYSLPMNRDKRGSFTELFRTDERGQFSVNITKPGMTKGEHWHHTKHEKFIVVYGNGLIQLRKIDSDDIINFYVSGNLIEVIDIPAGYTHNIINEGNTDLVTLMWANEKFDIEKPDTYSLKVKAEKEGLEWKN